MGDELIAHSFRVFLGMGSKQLLTSSDFIGPMQPLANLGLMKSEINENDSIHDMIAFSCFALRFYVFCGIGWTFFLWLPDKVGHIS